MRVPGIPTLLLIHFPDRRSLWEQGAVVGSMRRSPQYVSQVVLCLILLAPAPLRAHGRESPAQQSSWYQIRDDAILQPLTSTPGDPLRGREIVQDRERGNCLVCHAAPLPDRDMHGTLGPPLDGVGVRYSAGALRLRIVNAKKINPQSVMPAYYSMQGLYRVLTPYRNKPILTPQEVEDVVAYLVTLTGVALEPSQGRSLPDAAGDVASGANTRRSGYSYLSPDTQQIQNDDFANPGMLWVERGRELWNKVEGRAGAACATCHAEATMSMRGVRTRYPRFDRARKKLVNLEQQINGCRQRHMQAQAYAYESDALLALTTFISFHSRDLPIQVQIAGPARKFFRAGRTFFMQRRGQFDLACVHCHEQHAGQRLRGEVLSQGQSNGFPIYRQLWQALGSSHRMFAWCNTAIRAEPFALGSDEYVNLELYMAWRARGLPVESPAIRR